VLRNVIEKLGNQAILAGINPLRENQRSADPVIGFDTEYDSKTRELICYQLAGESFDGLFEGQLTVAQLAKVVRKHYPDSEGAWLITYWSYAELQFLPVLSKSFGWAIYGSGSFDCSFRTNSGFELRVFDISRFFERSSLAKVAQSFGLKKLEWDTTSVTRRDLKDPRFRKYAINDAKLCFQIMEALRAQFLPLGSDPLISKTAAGCTATVFRRQYVSEPIRTKIPKARLAGLYSCWGGRAEALRRGKFDNLYEYDITSAYPTAVIEIKRFPTGPDLKERNSLREITKGPGFARVLFTHPKSVQYPALPVVTPFAQIYPLAGITWATSFEIKCAAELGTKIEVLEGWGYSGGSTELYDMMQWALEMRRQSTGAKSVAAKLMANSLIGKLAQRRGGIDIEKLREFCQKQGVSLHDAIQLSSEELKVLGLERPNKVGTCFMPEWNSLITGYVRAQLHGILMQSEPTYCATDSVWSLSPIKNPPPGLGLKRKGPGAVVRTRFGAIFEPGQAPHLAHHSIWTRDAGLRLIQDFDRTERSIRYPLKRAIKLRESIRTRVRIATFVEELRQGNTNWDGKRRLFDSGETAPWQSADQYLQWRKEHNGKACNSAGD